MAANKVAVALSGGVDSAVTALLLKEQGFQVSGVTMCLCAGDDGAKALLAAEKIGIACEVLDLRKEFFDTILRYGREEYLCGRTPNPCARCNREFKFGMLAAYAEKNGACLATGHYAQLLRDEKGTLKVCGGIDQEKNQAYFLALVRRSALENSLMPLGGLAKSEVKQLAEKYGLESFARQKESQDVCVEAEGMTFPETLAALFPDTGRVHGNIVDTAGRFLGRHPGLEYYTIGQRKGLGVAMGKPAYVVELDAEKNLVVLSTDRNDLMTDSIKVKDMNIISPSFEVGRGLVQFRYRQRPMTASWQINAAGNVEITLDEPAARPAAGQVAAFFNNNELLAGGIIC